MTYSLRSATMDSFSCCDPVCRVWHFLMKSRSRLNWFGHVERRDGDSWLGKVRNLEIAGVSGRGRPRKQVISEDLRVKGLHREVAHNRAECAAWIATTPYDYTFAWRNYSKLTNTLLWSVTTLHTNNQHLDIQELFLTLYACPPRLSTCYHPPGPWALGTLALPLPPTQQTNKQTHKHNLHRMFQPVCGSSTCLAHQYISLFSAKLCSD